MINNQLTREQLIEKLKHRISVTEKYPEVEEAQLEAIIYKLALAVIVSAPEEQKVTCWSCRNKVEISAIGDCDGYCPECDSPIDLDEEPYTAPQPAPTIQVTDAMAYAYHHALTDGPLCDEDVEDIKTGLRSAFANATTNQPRPVLPDEFDRDKAFDLFNSFPDGDVVDCVQYTWNACRAAMLAVAPPAPKSTVK
ncbi:hypothetical protein ACSPON_001962 [Klebsiella aerogenes]|uniref:hypothetical protein n=1 Tax=Klebsiella aerogenes TaxID=548 RepID=UPI000C226A02|nr:hypothetical protein [Klebsiella aerogenes]ATX89051.1 hypothetical protein AM345_20055 [Klebsiella aerogenes]EKW5213058.1 hypothetical protein [Klebsiella aerogenes]ELA0081967.1 hypothetical protein [Klebsiella aerogenes]ELS4541258.1 hypothetical protein [Klebsiella aerogenes]